MAFISFALTKNEFLSGKKTVTRRRWKKKHCEMWQRFWDEGKIIHDAWDKSPFSGGKKIGQFKLTCRPYHEYLCNMPESDLEAEGGMCATKSEFYKLINSSPFEQVVVIRFQKLDTVLKIAGCKDKRQE